MEFTYLNQIYLLRKWNCVKFIQIMPMIMMMTTKLMYVTIEIHFILHVTNGFYITIQVYLHEYIYKY